MHIVQLAIVLQAAVSLSVNAFVPTNSGRAYVVDGATALHLFGGTSAPKIPSSANERDNIAIKSIKAAIDKPKTPGFALIECEFPPLESLNKLGDGSLRSANEVDKANLKFGKKLLQSIAPIPLVGPNVLFLVGASSSQGVQKAAKSLGGSFRSLRDGLPNVAVTDICLLLSPSSQVDYDAAQKLANMCKAVVVINGFAKDRKSIPPGATMGYFLKPLTYNSQIIGYLTRAYPSKWTTIDAITKKVLSSVDDDQILVRGTNTPDLRDAGRLVQKATDERAMKARQR